MGEQVEQNIKASFSKVKQDIQLVSNELIGLRQEVSEYKLKIQEISSKLTELTELLHNQKKEVSIGNEGVNQSINHLINQSINHQSFNQSINHQEPETPQKEQFNEEKGVNQSFNQSINQSPINHLINQSIGLNALTKDISKVFLSLSKQELKLFLTVYQLEDEEIESSYKQISIRMGLSEHCIRSHLSSLFKKNVPLTKKRTNNHTNLLSISKDFKILNLKSKLINLYYGSDPHQKTLFDRN